MKSLFSPLVGVSVGEHARLISRRTYAVLTSRGCHAAIRPHHMIRPAGQRKTSGSLNRLHDKYLYELNSVIHIIFSTSMTL